MLVEWRFSQPVVSIFRPRKVSYKVYHIGIAGQSSVLMDMVIQSWQKWRVNR